MYIYSFYWSIYLPPLSVTKIIQQQGKIKCEAAFGNNIEKGTNAKGRNKTLISDHGFAATEDLKQPIQVQRSLTVL